jgi:4-hydroxybenzoate polyprenyltransferase
MESVNTTATSEAGWRVLLEALRPHQWTKNLLVFAGLLFGRQLLDGEQVLRASVAFAAMCLAASATYLFNDLRDRAADREHPLKRHRPIASGRLAEGPAITAALAFTVIALGIGFVLGPAVGLTIGAYLALTAVYSIAAKHMVILDVMMLAAGFVLRVLVGAFAVDVAASYWLLLCTFTVALFLGFGKRRAELIMLESSASTHRPVLDHYSTVFLDQMIAIVTSATLVCYILYTVDRRTVEVFETRLLVLTVPFVLYGLFRYLYLLYHRRRGDSPTATILLDPAFLINGALWVAACAAIIYAHETLDRWIHIE